MNYLIIEDEEPAAKRLDKMILSIVPSAIKLDHLVSVSSSVQWLENNPHPDLIFMDIRLADGNSFEIFKTVKPQCPVIFTTAYDQYAIAAFKVNSIDYLLKPIKADELKAAISKFTERTTVGNSTSVDYKKLVDMLRKESDFQKRILIRFGDIIKAVEISDIAYFFTENKINYLRTFNGQNYPIDQNLDQIESIVDPHVFFRINRQFIVNIKAISRMVSYSKSRVKLELQPTSDVETIVSTERSPIFKTWIIGT